VLLARLNAKGATCFLNREKQPFVFRVAFTISCHLPDYEQDYESSAS